MREPRQGVDAHVILGDIAGKTRVHFIPIPAHDHLPEGDALHTSFSDHERLPFFSSLNIINIY
jgi:hypothetical protein